MDIYNVSTGKNASELSEYDLGRIPPKCSWLVYFYESEPYQGFGLAAALLPDGSITYWSLTHCSCYGPCDLGDDDWTGVPVEEFLTYYVMDDCVKGRDRNPNDASYRYFQAVVEKVRELTSNV